VRQGEDRPRYWPRRRDSPRHAKCSRAARRIIRCLIGEPAWARLPSLRGSPAAWSAATCRNPEEQAPRGDGLERDDRRRQVSGGSSRTAQGLPSRRLLPAKARSFCSLMRLHTIVGAGAAEGATDAGEHHEAAACPWRNSAPIGATTLDEYRKHIEKDPAPGARSSRCSSPSRPSRPPLLSCAGLKERYEVHQRRAHPGLALVAGGDAFASLLHTDRDRFCRTRQLTAD